MRRQTQPHGIVARWGMVPLDIDPRGLPIRYGLSVAHGVENGRKASDVIELCDNFLAVKHEVSGQKTVVRAFAWEEFSGIAVRIENLDDFGECFAVSVNLHHPDPKLCFPLHMSYDMDAVAERWHAWSRALNLPLLLPTADGGWREPIERFGKLTVNSPCQRTPRRLLASRRTSFSAVRETGNPALVTHVPGAELIARN